MTKDTAYNIITFLIMLFVIAGVFIFSSVGTYSNDDWWSGFFYSKSLIRNFLDSDQGLVISWFTAKFFNHALPEMFHLHPQQNIFMPIIKGINFALYIGILSLFFNVKEKKIPNPVVFLANTLLIFYIIFLYDIQLLYQVNQHFKYILNLIIGNFIWYVWINEFLNNRFFTGEKVLRDNLFAVLLAFSGHLVSIPTCILLTVLLLFKILKSKDNNENIRKLTRTFLPVIITYIICIAIYLNLPGFTYIRNTRLPEYSLIQYSINNFAIFTKEFSLHLFSTPYIYFLLLLSVAGILGLLIFNRKIDKKYIILSIAIFIANITFQYTFLTCGRTYYDSVSYWFKSGELTATFMFYLLLLCNLAYGCLFRLIDKKADKVLFIVTFFVIINLVYPMNKAIPRIKMYYERELFQRENIYKLNKIYRYYAITGDTIYAPTEYLNNINPYGQELWKTVNDNFILVYHVTKPIKDFQKVTQKISNEEELFTEEELKNINFKRLYDDNFILQMNQPKFF